MIPCDNFLLCNMPKWKLPDFTRDDSYETQETLDPRSQDARRWRGHRGFLRSPSCHRSAEPGDLKTEKDHVIWCFEMLMFKRKWPDQYDEANDAAKRQKGFSWQQHQLGWEVFGQVAWSGETCYHVLPWGQHCNMEYMVVPALIWAYQFSDAVIQLKDYTFLWNLLAPSDCTSSLTALFFRPAGRTIIADGRKS